MKKIFPPKISPRKNRRETPTNSMSKIFPQKIQGKEESWWTKYSPQKYLQGKIEERLPPTHPEKHNLDELDIAQGNANYQWAKNPRKRRILTNKIFPKNIQEKKNTESHRLILKSRISMKKVYPKISPRKRRILRFPKKNLEEKEEDWTQL